MTPVLRSSVALIVSVGFLAQAAAAQDAGQEGARDPLVLPPRVGVEAAAARVSLDDVIRMALEQNHDVQIARLDKDVAQQDVVVAEGAFDPHLTPSFSYTRATTPTVSSIGGSSSGSLSQRELAGGVNLDGRTPWLGSQYAVDFGASRLFTNNQFARVNPQYPSSLGLTFTQPLLRNVGIDAQRREILLARKALDLNDAQLTQVTMEELSLIEQAYWELVFAVNNVSVQADALQQARTQVSSNERQVQAGTLAAIDVVEAQTQVASFEQNLASAQQALTEAENRLKLLMLPDRTSPVWDQPLVPLGAQDRTVPTVSVDQAVTEAVRNRPELAGLAAQTAQNEIDRRYFHDQTKPQVDLVGSYTLAGLAGRVTTSSGTVQNASDAALLERLNELSIRAGLDPLVASTATGSTLPAFLQGGFPQGLSNLAEGRFPTAVVQLQMDLPLRNRTAQGNEAKAVLAGRQLDVQRKQLEQAVESDVRNALQRVQSAEQRLRSAGSAQRNAREQYDSERRRFDSGLSTVFLVLQRQTALVTAQGQELRARADLNQAVALFDRAIGNTLTQHGIALQH